MLRRHTRRTAPLTTRPPGHGCSAPGAGVLRRLALLAVVPASAYGLDRLLGPPLRPSQGGNFTVGLLAARLTPDGLHRGLVLCSWLAWLAGTLTLLPLVAARRARSGMLLEHAGPPDGHGVPAIGNRFEAPARRRPDRRRSTEPSPEVDLWDDTMSGPLAWGERFDDPDPWRALGPAEAGMTGQDIDDRAAVSDGGGERRWWRGRDEGAARPRRPRPGAFGRRRAALPEVGDRSPGAAQPGEPAAADTGLADLDFADPKVGDRDGDGSAGCAGAPGPYGTAGAADPPAGQGEPRVPVQVGGEMVDLLPLGSVALVGDDDDVAELLCSMVVDVVGETGGDVAAVLVGFGHEMHALDGVTVVDDEVAALQVAGGAPPSAGRAAIVLFVGGSVDAPGVEALVELAGSGQALPAVGAAGGDGERSRSVAVAVVVAGETPAARWRVHAGGGPLDARLVAQAPGSPGAHATRRAVAPAAPGDAVEGTAAAGSAQDHHLSRPIEVCVLGRVRVAGTALPFDGRPRLTELVVYLALHPEGATTDAWATALWPDRRMSPSTFANRLSEARNALGVARDGFAHLRKSGGRHHLGPEVTTDWDCFQALAGKADPDAWREALALVRGRPFEGLREPQWTILEGFVASIESGVVELACRLAEHLLATGDPEGAEWAARRAMLAFPWDERLYRLVMRAADAAGNRAGVEAALRQLARVLEAEGDPLAAVHPETAALYRSLMSRREAL